MEELAGRNPRSDHVRQRQPGRWIDGIPTERPGRAEGPERVCHLLLGDLDGHADAEQTMRDLQEHLPLGMSIPVVQEQQPEHVSSVPEQLCLCIIVYSGGRMKTIIRKRKVSLVLL